MRKTIIKSVITSIIILVCSTAIYSQQTQTVILKNGKELTGIIIENKNPKIVSLKTNTSILKIKKIDIKQILDSNSTEIYTTPEPVISKFKERGFFLLIETGTTEILDDTKSSYNNTSPDFSDEIRDFNANDNYDLSIVAGYKFKPYFTVGFYSGIEHINSEDLIPIGLYFRSEFIKKRVSPFVDMRFGGIIGMSEFIDFGAGFSIGAGLKVNLNRRVALNFSGGVKIASLWTLESSTIETIEGDEIYIENSIYANPYYDSVGAYFRVGINF